MTTHFYRPADGHGLPHDPFNAIIALDPATGRIYLATAEFTPSPDGPKARPTMVPNSFTILVAAPR